MRGFAARHSVALPLLAAAAQALAQAEGQPTATGITLTPNFSATQTLTDNRDLSSTDRQADLITQITPGLRIDARSNQLRGGLNLAVNALHYARQSSRNDVSLQTTLDSAFRWQALDNRVYVDASAVASQQAISAFGRQTAGTTVVDDNRSQVTTVSVAPGLRGRIGDWADVDARLNAAKTDAGATALGDSSSYGGQLSLDGRPGLFRWGLLGSQQVVDYKAGRETATTQLTASLAYTPRYDWRFTGRVGRARSDAIQQDEEDWVPTSGWTVDWQPTDRTQITLQRDRTYYGRSHLYLLRHRMERTVWSYTDSEGISGDPASGADGSGRVAVPLTIYDLLFANCLRGGGASAACDQSVRSFLASQGVSPTLAVGSGFLTAGITLQQSQNLAVALSLERQTATLSVFRTTTSALDRRNVLGDLAQVDRVRQQGVSLSLSHQLTPTSTLFSTFIWQKTPDATTTATGLAQPGNSQKMVTFGWSGQLTDRASAAVSVRRIDFDSATSPYQESAVLGSLGIRF